MQIFPTITSYGAAKTVTGSKHLITTVSGETILMDCGLFQGEGKESDLLNRDWGFNPELIDFVILSHAHIDHTGLLPKLVRDGFSGPIYCNEATKDLCEIMLMDGAHIQESDLKRINQHRKRKRIPPLEALYGKDDVSNCLSQFTLVQDNMEFKIGQSTHVKLIPNAHILGSSAIHLSLINMEGKRITLTFTGDIGRDSDQILDGPFAFPPSDYIISESTYGNRLHPTAEDAKEAFFNMIQDVCVEKNGKIVIPAFSIDRTQEIVYLLDQLAFEKRLPSIPVYVDSPLSVKATHIMSKHRELYNPEILEYITKDGDPFDFPNLHYVSTVEESRAINEINSAAIIISASGMAEAGRVKHHIANNIENHNNAILLVGYATPFSLAGQLLQGKEEVRIFGDFYNVNAKIYRMANFSAHADYNEMIDYLTLNDPSTVKKVFLVHGEESVMDEFSVKLKAVGFNHVHKLERGVIIALK
jgi:metallo-beta-lactamase family protein